MKSPATAVDLSIFPLVLSVFATYFDILLLGAYTIKIVVSSW